MDIKWTPEAEEKINSAPVFIRAIARKKVESLAKENGVEEITLEFVQKAQEKFMR